jgi:O-antigen/teichoic acid export membrane protein
VFRARTAQNVAIGVGLSWANQLLQIVSKVVLARLLFPDDFGVFALAAGLVGFVNTFGAMGLNYAIIQKASAVTKEDYDVGMSLRIVTSLLLMGVALVLAAPWASLFGQPLVAPTTYVLATMYLVTPWSFVPSTRLTAELRYKAQILPNLAGQVGYAAVAIALAAAGWGVWALVVGTILGQVATVVGYMLAAPWRFRFSLRWPVARPLLAYAWYLLAVAILAFLMANIDDFAVGYYLGTTQLGYYAVACALGYIPMTLISGPAGGALFPSFAKLQNDLEALRHGYLESFAYAVGIIAPAAIGLAVLAPELVAITLGRRWLPATLPLLILAFYGLTRALMDFSGSLFSAVGRPRTVAVMNGIVVGISGLIILPMTWYGGIAGAALAMTAPVAAVFALSVVWTARVLQTTPGTVVRGGKAPYEATVVMGVIVAFVRYGLYVVLPPRINVVAGLSMANATVVFLVGVPLGIVTYTAVLRHLNRDLFDGFWTNVGIALRRQPSVPIAGPDD